MMNDFLFRGQKALEMITEKPLFDTSIFYKTIESIEEKENGCFVRACMEVNIDPEVVKKQAKLIVKLQNALDDGFTQTVIVKQGIALKGDKIVKPIVKLKPFRTFNEVEQPESEFLLRLSDGGTVALFEADGGAWKLEATSSISDYIKCELSELIEQGKVIVAK